VYYDNSDLMFGYNPSDVHEFETFTQADRRCQEILEECPYLAGKVFVVPTDSIRVSDAVANVDVYQHD
jgi:hypothetical protein